MKSSNLPSSIVTLGCALLIAVFVAIYLTIGESLSTAASSFLNPPNPEFGVIQLALVLVTCIGFATVSLGSPVKKVLVYWLFFSVLYLIAALIVSGALETALYPLTTIFAGAAVCVTSHFLKLWRIDSGLTEKLVGLANTGNVLSDTPEMRVETSLKLLESIFPVSEIIVFRLKTNGMLAPIGRARKDDKPGAGVKRNANWQETVVQCESALEGRSTVEKASEYEENSASLAVPLDTGEEIVGVLYVDIRRNYEKGDRILLESFARQLARNYQRKSLKQKSLPHRNWWSSFSSQSSENRLFIADLIKGVLHEKSFGSLATSRLEQAHAVAYLDGTLAFLNPKMLEMAGFKPEEKNELNLFDLLDKFKTPVFSAPELAVRRVLQSLSEYSCELTSEESDQTLELKIIPVSLPVNLEAEDEEAAKPACLLITVENIDTALENRKLRSDMANLMSHELRTPITSINGFAEMLLADGNIPPDAREYLSIISSEAKRASALLSNFLSVANLEQADKVEFEKSPVTVEGVVNEVIEDFEPVAKKKRIRIVNKGGEKLPQVSADRGLLSKAIAHLVDNAIRYSPERTSVIISTVLETDFLRVDVEDRGYGIPKGEFEKIWQKFYRVSRDGQSKDEDTTGLGLSLVKEIAEQHEGSVKVASSVGRGSRFSFRLPRL